MSSSATLQAELRDKVGSRAARAIRAQNRIPCALQADKDHEHVDFHIDQAGFLKTRRAHAHLYDIDIGGKMHTAVVRELQYDALGSDIIHVEFKPVTRGVVTEAEVELSFVGIVTEGILNHNVSHITINCLPSMIPDEIEVRVAGLAVGTHIKASDLDLPEGATLAVDPDLEVAVVSAPKAEVVETETDDEDEEGDGEF